MDNLELYDDIPYDGGVPIRGAPTSAEEGASEEEGEVGIDTFRQALKSVVVVPRQAAAATTTRWDAPSPPLLPAYSFISQIAEIP